MLNMFILMMAAKLKLNLKVWAAGIKTPEVISEA